ncbi:similar to Saccharomyces cerevisiae YNL251C NRD1 RNA-binding protein, subunit of Nrd1 complex (Nrd1p-Nab3p-Sen1p) [Maudiozyma saulgeensis]|uniref:Similar to Saccharomyces cerevisiae YNL251C NRD1 RNA-binding protein, subunit of Nrd1 complex (Nrd1p-Nab3p-Sen1p) n=1 Tax=Maudiozyma saulgeensis TaxID=1789683 RepID=A0A1X7R3C9_9SACH|nr:similar to Saccharomyces cerevisiae YNL251C NRD1 RNA-binding protein, subunit of Nrd1 complex (Nrd1p-Nab3p-Sen1p) [Kazachstania saulgeensis]
MSNIENFEDFQTTLDSFKDLKSGISGSRIKKLTSYALEHVADEDQLMNSIITYARNCSNTHKLGSLYIIDSIGRIYLDEARAKDQFIKPTAPLGSYAHGVYTLGEAIQELLVDGINKSDEDHKEKIRMLIDIWDRSGLFQKGYLNAVRAKCFSMEAPTKPTTHLSSVTGDSGEEFPDDPKERAQYILSNIQKYDTSKLPQLVVPSLITSSDPVERQQALEQLLKEMNNKFNNIDEQNIEEENLNNKVHVHRTTEYGSRREREKQSRSTRSRSPRRDEPQAYSNQNSNNMRHGSDTTNYGGLRPNQSFGANNHHLYPEEANVPANPHHRPKPISYDNTLPPDTIKVYSRTLFIGGVPMHMKEWDLASLLKPYAEVQSVILNHNRKHAFVKVYSRREAENAFMNFNRDGALALRTRWGVGFGPRDCCDYQSGSSNIPLHRLTDADKKWSVEAEWGGTGGQPLVPGIAFEEPDIVVGEGVSSKSMSQKMPTDSNANGPTSNSMQYKAVPPPPQNMYGNMQQMPPQGMYGAPPPPPQLQQGQVDMYNNNMISQPPNGYPPQMSPPPAPQGTSYPMQENNPPVQNQNNVDPTAQLNSLMSMINQQQQH